MGLPAPDLGRVIDDVSAELELPHVLASSAIPVAFPAVDVQQPPTAPGWYTDGGVRLKLRSPDFPLLRRLVGGGEGPRAGDVLS